MQVVDLYATVLFFVMLAVGAGNYNSSCVLGLSSKKLIHQSPLRLKAFLGHLKFKVKCIQGSTS